MYFGVHSKKKCSMEKKQKKTQKNHKKTPANHRYWWPNTLSPKHQWVKGHKYQWLAGGYDLEIGHF